MKKIWLLMFILLGLFPHVGAAELVQTIITTVPPAVSITNLTSVNTGSIDPLNGVLSNQLTAKFKIDTNGDDSRYNFILQANVNTQSGLQNAFTPISGGYGIILANINSLPTLDSINNIKGVTTLAGNPNAIAYPQTVTRTNFQNVSIQTIPTIGLCYKVLIGSAQSGTVTENVLATPVANTYSNNDNAGTYQATITMSAYSL